MQGVVFSNNSVSVAPEFEAMYDASCALWTRVRPRFCMRLHHIQMTSCILW